MVDEVLGKRKAAEIVRAVWPEVIVGEVSARTGGQLSSVYEVRCARPDVPVIVKMYDEQWRWKQGKEAFVYRLLRDAGVGGIPEILRVEPDAGPVGRAYTVLTMLSGSPLSQVSPGLGAVEVAVIYRQIGAVLARIHRIGQGAYGYLTTRVVDPEADNTAYMRRQFDKKLGEFAALGGDPGLHAAATAYLTDHAGLLANCAVPVLCHNDFHKGNVLVEDSGDGWVMTGFVDVENAVAGDPLLDLAKTDYYAVQGDPVKREALWEGYGPLPGDWVERVALYRLYHALELWDWFASIGETAHLSGIAADIRELT